jgi:hypothetical protein
MPEARGLHPGQRTTLVRFGQAGERRRQLLASSTPPKTSFRKVCSTRWEHVMQAWIRPCLPRRQTCTSTVSFDSQNASLPFPVPSGSLRVPAFVHSEVIPSSGRWRSFPEAQAMPDLDVSAGLDLLRCFPSCPPRHTPPRFGLTRLGTLPRRAQGTPPLPGLPHPPCPGNWVLSPNCGNLALVTLTDAGGVWDQERKWRKRLLHIVGLQRTVT